MQVLILFSLFLWSLIDPSENLALVVSVGLLIAVASATQDITVDALRIEQIGENEAKSMAAGAAMAVVGWWSGYKLGGVISLFSAEILQKLGFDNYWQLTFIILGSLIILMNIGLMFVKETENKVRNINQASSDELIANKLGKKYFYDLFSMGRRDNQWSDHKFFKNGFTIALSILGFVFLFKVGEAFLGRMSIILRNGLVNQILLFIQKL